MGKLLDVRSVVALQVCRFHHRRGLFGVQPHHTNEHMIIFVERGILLAQVRGRQVRVHAGDAIWIPPGGSRWMCGAMGNASVRQCNVRFQLSADGHLLSCLKRPLYVKNVWDIQPVLHQLHDFWQRGHVHGDLRLRGLLVCLTTTLLAGAPSAHRAGRTLTPGQRLILTRYVEEHLDESITPTQLAEAVQLSGDYFTRLFRATYGLAPRYHLKRERMRLAAVRLCDSSLSIKQVAHELGVSNMALFSRQFREVMGCTPGVCRKRGLPPIAPPKNASGPRE